MSNIYTSRKWIQALHAATNLTAPQSEFLSNYLSNSKIDRLFKYMKNEELIQLINSIQHEIKRTPYFNFKTLHFNIGYRNNLGKILKILQQCSENKTHQFQKKNPKKAEYFASRLDMIFEKTKSEFNGELLLPVKQGADVRLGPSHGECFGYTAEWAISMLHGKAPFHFNPKVHPALEPIKFNSSVGRKYPDLNHFAHLTKSIADYQSHQRHIQSYIQSLDPEISKNTHLSDPQIPIFYKSTELLAERLIKHIYQNKGIHQLSLIGSIGGHAMGFCEKESKFHFFDCNSGWYIFEDAQDFKKWLPFYFKQMEYPFMLEASIRTYTAKAPEKHNKFENIAKAIIIVPFLPIILLATTGYLTYFFCVRPIIYACNKVYNFVAEFFKNTVDTVSEQESKRNDKLAIEKAADRFQKAQNDSPLLNAILDKPLTSKSAMHSYHKISALLDIPLQQIQIAQKKAAQHPEIFKKALLENPSQIKHEASNQTTIASPGGKR